MYCVCGAQRKTPSEALSDARSACQSDTLPSLSPAATHSVSPRGWNLRCTVAFTVTLTASDSSRCTFSSALNPIPEVQTVPASEPPLLPLLAFPLPFSSLPSSAPSLRPPEPFRKAAGDVALASSSSMAWSAFSAASRAPVISGSSDWARSRCSGVCFSSAAVDAAHSSSSAASFATWLRNGSCGSTTRSLASLA
eukprot:4416416-Pleurochrysis_carterae.AAC.1